MADKKNAYEGSQIVPVRIVAELLEQIDKACQDSIATRDDEPYTRSSFILYAVREVFKHRARARKSRLARQAEKRGKLVPLCEGAVEPCGQETVTPCFYCGGVGPCECYSKD